MPPAGSALSAGLGERGAAEESVRQGKGSVLRGRLRGPRRRGRRRRGLRVRPRAHRAAAREFLGFALSGAGRALPLRDRRRALARARAPATAPGTANSAPGRCSADGRAPDPEGAQQGRRNKRYARFFGQLPGPDNDRVVVVLQVKQGKGWRAFRRYRTRNGGRYRLVYRFGRTTSPATYLMRAQVRRQGGYPYLPGNSKLLRLRVIP